MKWKKWKSFDIFSIKAKRWKGRLLDKLSIFWCFLPIYSFPGPAALDGRLRVGDQLIEINSQSTKNMTHGEAIELIKNGGLAVRLLVRRGKAPNSAFLGEILNKNEKGFHTRVSFKFSSWYWELISIYLIIYWTYKSQPQTNLSPQLWLSPTIKNLQFPARKFS